MSSVLVKNEALQTQKDVLISPQNLRKALGNGSLKLVKIDDKYVVPVGGPTKGQVAKLDTAQEDGR